MKIMYLILALMTTVVFAGCASNKNTVMRQEQFTHKDVITEAKDSKPVEGKALVKISLPIKTYKSRIANQYIKHANPPYTVNLNIDGQMFVLKDEAVLEDVSGDFRNNPEVGTGWKYNFNTELILNPGKHKVSIEVPLSGVVFNGEVALAKGENVLSFTPVYNSSISRNSSYPKFVHGLKGLLLQHNSKPIRNQE